MRRKRLLWQIFPAYLLITWFSLVAVTWYMSGSLRKFYRGHVERDLEARARLVQNQLSDRLLIANASAVDRLCKDLGEKSSTRITVILPSGEVIGDSEEDPAKMEDHADRPEIRKAMAGERGAWTRTSPTLQIEMTYVAFPLVDGGQIVGVVRTAFPVEAMDEALRTIGTRIMFGGLAIAVLAGVISWNISRRITRPLEEMQRGAQRFARGELTGRLPMQTTREMGALAEALNDMAEQLDERLRTMFQQRNELEAVLSSMVEGVLAVDNDDRIIMLNQAAAQFLGLRVSEGTGRSIQEVVRNVDLQKFVQKAQNSEDSVEAEVTVRDKGERFLQAHGAVLHDGEGHDIGALVVLNDITRLRRLEKIRRDFVANVSHELRTPVTSIKGFVETLLDGAIHKPTDAERFLRIVAGQVDRLNAIIVDLLTLSRIEQGTEAAEITLERGRIKDALEAAIQVCEVKAASKNISIELTCEEELEVRMNAPLLEQAVVNLVDNAIKYSNSGDIVQVLAAPSESDITISVRDRGCGIAREHLSRLFERFYRVDKARSRELGGTGLGLAIVKHIAKAHGGRVSAESVLGKGSTFSIHLPLA